MPFLCLSFQRTENVQLPVYWRDPWGFDSKGQSTSADALLLSHCQKMRPRPKDTFNLLAQADGSRFCDWSSVAHARGCVFFQIPNPSKVYGVLRRLLPQQLTFIGGTSFNRTISSN